MRPLFLVLFALFSSCLAGAYIAPALAQSQTLPTSQTSPTSPITPIAIPAAPAEAASAPPLEQQPEASTAPAAPIAPLILETVKPAPVAASDLWDRIRRGYRMPDLAGALVDDRTQWYASKPDYMTRMTERSSLYLHHILEELERRSMPTELALLPFIESAFRPDATSSAKAAGMWQFIPSTGKEYKLKQNMFRDDRRHVLASTGAALDYLNKLYGMFGDWHLALAAYNWGEGSVQRAQQRNEKAGLGTSYLDLNMPVETRQYVPKLQAVKNIISNPGAYNVTLPAVPNHAYFDTVTIKRDLDVALAAKLADLPLAEFHALNPSYKKPVILAASRPEILLPYDNASVFRRNYDRHEGRLSSWTATTLTSTQKPAAIAARYGISEEQLRSINGIPPRMLIKAGSTLVVPRNAVSNSVQDNVSESVADNATLAMAPDVPPLRRAAHKVRKGESLASIAKRYGTNVASLKGWNRGIADKPRAGHVLTVYVPNRGKYSAGKGKRTVHKGHAAKRGKVGAGRTLKAGSRPAAKGKRSVARKKR